MIDGVDLQIHEPYTNVLIDSILNDCIQNGRQSGGYRHSDINIEHATHSTPFSKLFRTQYLILLCFKLHVWFYIIELFH
jgi:hypothetical protein